MDERLGQHETPEDVAAAERFAGVLDTLEAGGQPDVDALVDAELASLLRTADAVREPGLGATETVAFHSYRARSRAFVLHTLEQQRVAGLAPSYPAATRAGATQRTGIIDFVVRHRGWTVFAPVAAAAAAAGLVLFTPLALAPEENRPALATNLTSVTTALAELNQRSRNGQPVDASLLRTITESTTAAANRIETQPQSVSKTHVENYQRAIAQSSTVLGTLQAAVGVEDALAAAQRATQDGKVTATRFLGAESAVGASTGNPAAASTATPTSTPAPAPTVAPAAVTTATPTPTATATATATTRAGTVAP